MTDAMKLKPLAMGLALGVFWGVCVFITGITAYIFSYGKPILMAMSSLYIGYEPSVQGSIVGGLFGFLDGLIGGVVVAFLYNLFLCCNACCPKSACCEPTDKKAHKK